MGIYRRVINVVRRAANVGVNGPFNLSVNPITYSVLHVDGLVANATAVGVDQPWTDIDNITVSFNGASVLNINGEDLRALLVALGWRVPYIVNHPSATNSDLVRLSIPIPFSRKRFWLNEGFPASRSGELQMSVSFVAQGATFTTRFFSIESNEVLDMVPRRFLKAVTQSKALTAGDQDFELPKGNDLAGVLIFEPALADSGVASGTLRSIKFLLDDVEFGIANARFESMRDMFEQRGGPIDMFEFGALPRLARYALIDFDPLQDGEYLVPTVGRSSVKLRPEIDTAGTVRAIPIELVAVETAMAGVQVPGV